MDMHVGSRSVIPDMSRAAVKAFGAEIDQTQVLREAIDKISDFLRSKSLPSSIIIMPHIRDEHILVIPAPETEAKRLKDALSEVASNATDDKPTALPLAIPTDQYDLRIPGIKDNIGFAVLLASPADRIIELSRRAVSAALEPAA